MSYFRYAVLAGAGDGQTWEIDCNEAFPNSDGGAQWNALTSTAMRAFQSLGIPVFPCCKKLDEIKHLKRNKYHFKNDLIVQHAMAHIAEAAMHLALAYASIKEIYHGGVRPWGDNLTVRDPQTSFKSIWETWPKSEGLGIPGPAHWENFRGTPGRHPVAPFGVLHHCIAAIRFKGKRESISFQDIADEEFDRGLYNPILDYRDYQWRQKDLIEITRRVVFHKGQCVNIGRTALLKDESILPDEMQLLLYQTEAAHPGAADEGAEVATSSRDHQGAFRVEGTIGARKVRMAPEPEAEVRKRWNGFKLHTNYEPRESDGVAADPSGRILAIGENQLHPSRRGDEPAPPIIDLMKCVEADRLKQARLNAEQMQQVSAPTQNVRRAI
jgi:hypothetical protein